ncbi:MAG: hypothetical protein ABI779_15060 [Acidobacteriota bacterium]
MLAFLALFAVLFPAPLHLTREITDPVTGGKSVVEEYCHGNRVVAVTGTRTAIAEYDKGVLTVIDFEAGTYSVTKFDDLARAWAGSTTTGAERTGLARTDSAEPAGSMQLKGDQRHLLTRDAVEVLLGLAYPSHRDASADAAVSTLRTQGRRAVTNAAASENAAADYALPLEQVQTIDVGGESVEVRNTVVRVGSELAPPDVLAVPSGARLVESSAIAARRMLEELDGKRP